MVKKIIIISFLLGFLFFFLYEDKKEGLEIIFFDVGQGDSSLIKLPTGETILIDGGPDNLVLNRLGEFLPFYKREIDLILISHWHDDHVVGLIETMRRYRVKNLIYIEGINKSKLANYLLSQAEFFKVNVFVLKNKLTLDYGSNCQLSLLNPLAFKVRENDNNSLVSKLDCQGVKVLFSGDNELAVEKALLQNSYDLKSQIFKASHHGSKTSNSLDFLQVVDPKIVVVSVGADNKFGHPADVVMENILKIGAEIRRTDQDLSILFKFIDN